MIFETPQRVREIEHGSCHMTVFCDFDMAVEENLSQLMFRARRLACRQACIPDYVFVPTTELDAQQHFHCCIFLQTKEEQHGGFARTAPSRPSG